MDNFIGVSIALIKGTEVLVIQRDNKPNLQYANMWDFPGGKREGNEAPLECITREVHEELGIKLDPKAIRWEKIYPGVRNPHVFAYFMVAEIDDTDLANIVFGNEGKGWKMMKQDDFISNPSAIEPFKSRLNDYLASRN